MQDKKVQLPVRISQVMMNDLKKIARLRNTSVTTIVIRALIQAIHEELKYQ